MSTISPARRPISDISYNSPVEENTGMAQRALGVMPPKVLSYCIDDAIDRKADNSPIVSVNIGLAVGRVELVDVDVNTLLPSVKAKMIKANGECSVWFTEYDPYIFELISDQSYPWTSLNMVIPRQEAIQQIIRRNTSNLMLLEAIPYIHTHYPDSMGMVREALADKAMTLVNFLDLMAEYWVEYDVGIAANTVIIAKLPCWMICQARDSYQHLVPDSVWPQLIKTSLAAHWSRANFEAMSADDQELYRKVFKMAILKQGMPMG